MPAHLPSRATRLALFSLLASGCTLAPPAREEVSTGESAVATAHPEWRMRSAALSGGTRPAQGLTLRCVHEGASPRALCMAGGIDHDTTAASVTPAPTYALDGSTYLEIASAAASPTGRRQFALSSFASAKKAVVFGGLRRQGIFLDDTWSWDGAAWKEEAPAHRPPARWGATLVEDPSTGRVVLFGGRNETKSFHDLWEWDGTDWTERTPEGDYPTTDDDRGLDAAAFTPHGFLLVADLHDTSSQWSYRSGRFTKLSGRIPRSHGARGGGAFAFHEGRGTLELFSPSGTFEGRFDASGAVSWTRLLVARQGAFPGFYGYAPRTEYATTAVFDKQTGATVVMEPNGDGAELHWRTVANEPPTLAVPWRLPATFAGDEVRFQGTVTDRDDGYDALRVTAKTLPAGATFDGATRTLTWTPTPAQKGTHTITLEASDGEAVVERSTTVEVLWNDYAMLPKGPIDLLTTGAHRAADNLHGPAPDPLLLTGMVTLPTRCEERTWSGWRSGTCPWDYGAPEVGCRFTGENPGKVVATCAVDATSAVDRYGITSAPVREDGAFVMGRLIDVPNEGPAAVIEAYLAHLNDYSRVRQIESVTSLLRPTPSP